MGDQIEGVNFFEGQGQSGGAGGAATAAGGSVNPYLAGAGGLFSILGGIGAFGSTRPNTYGPYDPSQTALSRYKDLTDPSSQYHMRLKALYSKYFAEGSPTINTLLGVAKAAGVNDTSATSLAYQQGKQIANTNNENVTTSLQRQMLQDEGNAQSYLGMHYKMLEQQSQQNFQARQQGSENGGSFGGELLGLGGKLLGMALI